MVLFFYYPADIGNAKKKKSKKKKKSSKAPKSSFLLPFISDMWLYFLSLVLFTLVTAIFRRFWVKQLFLIGCFWVFLFLFSYRFDPVAKNK